jgi:hypothetical protein
MSPRGDLCNLWNLCLALVHALGGRARACARTRTCRTKVSKVAKVSKAGAFPSGEQISVPRACGERWAILSSRRAPRQSISFRPPLRREVRCNVARAELVGIQLVTSQNEAAPGRIRLDAREGRTA